MFREMMEEIYIKLAHNII